MKNKELKKPTKTKDKIKELKTKIISEGKDARYTEKMLSELLRLQKSEYEMSKELDIPASEVKETLDFDSYTLKRTIRGILFTAKGGMSIFVTMRMASVYQMLYNVFELMKNPPEGDTSLANAYKDSVAYVCQALIFCSLDSRVLFSTATHLLKEFNTFLDEKYTNAEEYKETQKDIEINTDFEKAAEGFDFIANSEPPK